MMTSRIIPGALNWLVYLLLYYLCIRLRISKDKTMEINWLTSPMMINKDYPFCKLELLKSSSSLEPKSQNSIKVQKGHCSYEALGTSLIFSLMSHPS